MVEFLKADSKKCQCAICAVVGVNCALKGVAFESLRAKRVAQKQLEYEGVVMKVGKIAGIIVLLVLLVVGLGVFYLFSNINPIVERAIETKGPEITDTDVSLGSVDIQLLKGRAELSNFTIANPAEFDTGNLFEARSVVFNIEPTSLRSDVIVINEILIEGVRVTAEQKGLTTNIQTMLKTIEQNLPKAEDEPVQNEEGKVLRFMVERLRFADSSLRVVTEKYGEKELTLAEVEGSNLGSRTAGLTAAELGVAVVKPYLQRARQQAQEQLRTMAEGEVKDRAEEKLREKFGDDAEEKLNKVRELF